MPKHKMTDEDKDKLGIVAKILSSFLGSGPGPDHVSIDQWEDGSVDLYATRTLVTKSEDQRLVTGVVLEPEVVDSHGDIYSSDEIFKAMESFNTHCRVTKLQHSVESGSIPVESWQTKNDEQIGGQDIKKGTWLMTMRLPDDEFEMVKKGVFTGFSVGCKAATIDLHKSAVKPKRRLIDFDFSQEGAEVSLVDKAANKRTILITKANDQEVVDIEKGLEDMIAILSGMSSYQEKQDPTDPLKAVLGSLEASAQALSELLGINPDGLFTSNVEHTYSSDKSSDYEYLLEKSDMKVEDLQKALESDEGKTFLDGLINKALEADKEELKKAQEKSEQLESVLKALEKREAAKAEEEMKDVVKSYSDLGMDVEKDLDLFKSIAGTGEDNFNRFKEILDTAKSSMENADVLDAKGADSLEEDDAIEADSGIPKEVLAKAEELRKADANLTLPQAITKALGR